MHYDRIEERHKNLLTTVFFSVIITAIVSFTILWKAGFNAGNLVFMGRNFGASRYWDKIPLYINGYDGQFYYSIANNPFDLNYLAQTLDNPIYRYRRIFYPLLVWGLTLGGRIDMPLVMYMLNAFLMPVVATLMALILIHHRVANKLSYYCCAFTPSFLFTLKYSLAEGVGTALVLAGVYLYLKSRHPQAAFLLLLAGFTREIYILVSGVILVMELVNHRRFLWQYYLSGCVYAAFWLSVPLVFGESLRKDAHALSENFSLVGVHVTNFVFDVVKSAFSDGGMFSYASLVIIFVLYIFRYIFFAIRQSSGATMNLITALGLLFGAIALIYGKNIWNVTSSPESFIRISDLFLTFSFLAYSLSPENRKEVVIMPVLYALVLVYLFQRNDIGIYDFR